MKQFDSLQKLQMNGRVFFDEIMIYKIRLFTIFHLARERVHSVHIETDFGKSNENTSRNKR